MQGVCDYLHTTSFELQVKMCSSTQFQQPGFLSTSLKRQSFDGVLVLASWMLNRYDAVELRKERIPFVLIGCRDADGFAPSIEANNEAIVRELVGRLAAQGTATSLCWAARRVSFICVTAIRASGWV